MNAIREEFLLLAEKLKLDTRFVPLDIIGTPKCTPSFLDAHFTKTIANIIPLSPFIKGGLRGICVGPYIASWSPLTLTLPLKGGGKGGGEKLSDRTLESLVDVYKKLFLSHRRIRFIGVDLDDCLYDVTPIRSLVSGVKSLESRLLTPDSELKTLYKPYEGVKETLKYLMSSGVYSSEFGVRSSEKKPPTHNSELTTPNSFIVGILTNGSSKLQKDKIGLLGLKEGEHFNFVMVSEDVGISKPSREFFELAKQKASQLRIADCGLRNYSELRTPNSELRNEECLILEDQVKNLSGADGWLKVQFLKGYHSNILPSDVKEIPKYGITDFSTLSILLNLEKDSEFQTMAASYFVLKSLLLLLSEIH